MLAGNGRAACDGGVSRSIRRAVVQAEGGLAGWEHAGHAARSHIERARPVRASGAPPSRESHRFLSTRPVAEGDGYSWVSSEQMTSATTTVTSPPSVSRSLDQFSTGWTRSRRSRRSASWVPLRALVWLSRCPERCRSGSDQIARGVADGLRDAGIRVPDEIAIVGFDNWDVMVDVARPPLTTIDPNLTLPGPVSGQPAARRHRRRRLGLGTGPAELRPGDVEPPLAAQVAGYGGGRRVGRRTTQSHGRGPEVGWWDRMNEDTRCVG